MAEMTDSIPVEEILDVARNDEKYTGATKVEILMLGWEEAEWFLEKYPCNTNNRKVTEANVKKLYEAMKNGDFKLSNDAITFTVDGLLINGQHRLYALLKFKEDNDSTKFPFIVMSNAPKDTKLFINNCQTVTNNDRAKMFLSEIGLDDDNNIWGAITQILCRLHGGGAQNYSKNNVEVTRFAEQNKDVLLEISKRGYMKKNNGFGIDCAPIMMCLEYLLTQQGTEQEKEWAREFFQDIEEENYPKGSPLGKMHDWFMKSDRNKYASAGNAVTEIAVMMTWDAYKDWKRTGKHRLTEIVTNELFRDKFGNLVVVGKNSNGLPIHKMKNKTEYRYRNYMKRMLTPARARRKNAAK